MGNDREFPQPVWHPQISPELLISTNVSKFEMLDSHNSPSAMSSVLRKTASLILIALALNSCGDDPKLVEKLQKQKTEIAALKGELSLIQEKLSMMPADTKEQLAKARKESEKQIKEIETLENEVASLDARKRNLQAEFDSYRAKYQTK